MRIVISPGRYIVAVSGGVDSVVLLDMLSKIDGLELVVAHYDHGIRQESGADCEFVRGLAERYSLPFVAEQGKLGAHASEALAREFRYSFLQRMVSEHGSQAIITAHHQDDVIETIVINLIRGTGRKGLSSLRSTEDIVRPLLGIAKLDLVNYAEANNLQWHEDKTNNDPKYLRNWVRINVVPKFSDSQRQQLLHIYESMIATNQTIDSLLEQLLGSNRPRPLDRRLFNSLPHSVAKELMAYWLRLSGVQNFDTKLLSKLTVGAKVLPAGKRLVVNKGLAIVCSSDSLVLDKY